MANVARVIKKGGRIARRIARGKKGKGLLGGKMSHKTALTLMYGPVGVGIPLSIPAIYRAHKPSNKATIRGAHSSLRYPDTANPAKWAVRAVKRARRRNRARRKR